MMFLLTFLCVVALVAAQRDYRNIGVTRMFVERSKPRSLENGWVVAGKPNPKVELEFTIAINGKNSAKLENVFNAVSDPQSSQYGKHLSLNQIKEMFGASDETISALQAWIVEAGATVKEVSIGRSYMVVSSLPTVAEKLFETEFFEFSHPVGGRLVRALAPYSAPLEVSEHVAYVSNVHGLPAVPKQRNFVLANLRKRQNNPLIGPKELRQRYNVTQPQPNMKNKQAVAEFQGQFYSPSDLTSFFSQHVTWSKNDTVAGVVPPNSNNPNAPGVEASLDIEYIMGVGSDVATYFYEQPSFDFWSGLTAWAGLLDNDPSAPFVHSISYGDQAAASKPSKAYQTHLSQTFMKLGARGLSIIFASGDSGSGCNFCVFLEPSFPATSPYVTSVGATRFINGVGPEMAVEEFHSGGGFSWDFATPTYQAAAVKNFLATAGSTLPWSFEYNKDGRATPDVSALGIGFAVVNGGQNIEVGGTSASAPTFSAIVSLLNDLRLNAKKSPLGFLNHWIYQTAAADPSAFYDVTQGTNNDGCCFTGFTAIKGYDPVTGVGTPNYRVLATKV